MTMFRANDRAPFEDPQVWKSIRGKAWEVVETANQTSAPIGITYRQVDEAVRITSRGAPAVALEVGTSRQPAKRYVKRSLDQHRLR